MTEQEWTVLAGLIDEWWPGKFEPTAEDAWWIALADYEAETVTTGLKVLLAGGGTFRPSVAELIAAIRRDPSEPTFAEACELIFGRGGVLSARTAVRKAWWEAGEREELNDAARWERAAAMHPLIGSFIQRQGMDRLRRLNLEDSDFGEARRKQLHDAWEENRRAAEGRDIAAIAGPRGAGGLRELDPMAALKRGPLELVVGSEAA